ncbi:hypothetical protein WJX72_001554 [[Myrmecia] bisecta]|uniref:Cytochrome b561 domain-containing protein n=1 Tax=[Myrmecia] bisecta TaxID=41462 RepID=A0AAW1Q3E7_9CHLO
MCCPGATVAPYSLDGMTPDLVRQESNALSVVNSSAARSADGHLSATFYLNMPQSMQQLAATALPIISAVGPVGSDDSVQQHAPTDNVAGTINFGSGASSVAVVSLGKRPQVHAWLMITSWGFMIPVGVMIARYLRAWDPWWFHLHRGIQLTAVLAGFAGMGVGISMGRPMGTQLEQDHRIIGFTVMGLGFLQVLAIILRPHKEARIRRYWNWYHWWVGRSAVALAITNVYLGLKVYGERKRLRSLFD